MKRCRYDDAIFVFPEGQCKVDGKSKPPSQTVTVTPPKNQGSLTTYDALRDLLDNTRYLMDDSEESYASIIDWLIEDLASLRKKLKK